MDAFLLSLKVFFCTSKTCLTAFIFYLIKLEQTFPLYSIHVCTSFFINDADVVSLYNLSIFFRSETITGKNDCINLES